MSIPSNKLRDSKHGIHINLRTVNTDTDQLHDSFLHQGHEEEEEDDDDELIRVVSRGNRLGLLSAAECSYGKVIGRRFSMRSDLEDEKQNSTSGIEKAMRRAFSMRASSAAANEVYRRIDDEYDSVPVADEENTIVKVQTRKEESNKKANKILEACRRFFGF